MKNKFNKARQEATNAVTEQDEEIKKTPEGDYPEKFNSFIDFAREQGIEDAAIFDAINKAIVAEDNPEQKAKNRKSTKGAFGGKKQKSQK